MSVALKFTNGDENKAKDLFQEALCRCIKLWGEYENLHENQQKQIICTAVRNIAIDQAKKKKTIRISCDLSKVDFGHEPTNDYDDKLLMTYLHKNSEDEHIKLFLLFYNGYSYKEISLDTGLCINTVKSHIRYGKNKIRKFISENEQTLKEYINPPKIDTKGEKIKKLAKQIDDNLFFFLEKTNL